MRWEINLNADNYRLREAKATHDAVLGKTDASPMRKTLSATETPHLDTKALMKKLDDAAKRNDLDVSTTVTEQIEDPVLGTVRSWLPKGVLLDRKPRRIQQSKRLLRSYHEFDRLLIGEEGEMLCYNELSDKLEDDNLWICLPLLLCFSLFQPWTLQWNEWTNGCSKNLQQYKTILPLAWYVWLDLWFHCWLSYLFK